MTLNEFRRKYGTYTFELIVRRAVDRNRDQTPESLAILEEALADLESVLKEE